ncbi:hypothetical protein ERO13_D05G048950v2 [Gossypium hirsutum]|nr:hypothetical protein ERO13_D05G048950v2 [Gossypium hirsutum]
MACYYYVPFQGHCSFRNPTLSFSLNFNFINTTHHLASSFKPFLRELEQHVFGVGVLKAAVKNTSVKLLDAFVDSAFQFVDYPLDPSQVYINVYVYR